MPSLPNIQKTPYFHVFFEKDHLHFPSVENISYFREKGMPSFLLIKERSYSSPIFLERSSFQNIWKKKISFFVQWIYMHILFFSILGYINDIKSYCYTIFSQTYSSLFYLMENLFLSNYIDQYIDQCRSYRI